MRARSWRTSFIAGLLLLALALTAAVAWQAHDAARSHRATAEAVLHDYAALTAGELIRRSTAVMGQRYLYYVQLMLQRATEPDGPLPTPGEMVPPDPRPALVEAAGVVRYVFRFEPGSSGSLEVATAAGAAAPTGAEEEWLAEALAGVAPGFPAANLRHAMLFGPPATPVMAMYWVQGEPGEEIRVLGAALDRGALHRVFTTALGVDSALPAVLAGTADEDGNPRGDGDSAAALRLAVRDWTGRVVFRSGPEAPFPDTPEAVVPFTGEDAERGEGSRGKIFAGFTATAQIAPQAAPDLIIGGLPRSRLPWLLASLALAVALVAAALALLARERELARLRSDFVSRVSHELRTPLTQIRMFAETLLLERVRSPEEARRSLEIVDGEARRLSHLVENILQFSRSERGALEVAPQPRDLSRLVTDLVAELRPLVESGRLDGGGRVRLLAGIEPGIAARVDPDALHQIVLNLLENAVKYGGGDAGQGEAEIRLALERRAGVARLTVEDDGPGVPRRERGRVWQPFHRLERDAGSAGTGIGLAVVRELVHAHGGRVDVEDGEPRGARFVVELPLAETRGETRDDEEGRL